MKIVRRIINYINLFLSFIPLVIFTLLNIYALYVVAMSFFKVNSLDFGTWIIGMCTYMGFIGPVCLVIIIIYAFLWLMILILSITELILAESKKKVAINILEILTNIASYILLAWLVPFSSVNVLYMLFAGTLVQMLGGVHFFVSACAYLMVGIVFVVEISSVATILYSIILIIDLIVSKIRSKKAEGLVQKQ